MRKTIYTVFILLGLGILLISWQGKEKNISPVSTTRTWILHQLESCKNVLHIPATNDIETLKKTYLQARKYYKPVEFFVEYCSPREAKYFINGALVPKHDEEFGKTMRAPQGFQRLEELLYGGENPDITVLQNEYQLLSTQLEQLQAYYAHVEINEGLLLEMCQVELFRICTMNLNGYDATILQNNVEESAWCLQGIQQVITSFEENVPNKKAEKIRGQILKKLKSAESYLLKNKDYATFDRLHFITRYINPINPLLIAFHRAYGFPWSAHKKALCLQEPFLFGHESFNTRFFSMYYDDTLHLDQQAELGKILFFDPVLSGNNQRACAGCHQPNKAFTDGLTKSISVNEKTALTRNAPTLLNVAYQKAFFYDGRAYQLEQQIFDVIHNQEEMHSNLETSVERLKQSKTYRDLFARAFAGTPDSSITTYAVQKALTEYEKTLVSFNSRFDQYLRGNKKALSQREINGYNVFAGKALCGSCHFMPLFNGTVPPFYNDSEYEVIGVAQHKNNRELDDDKGRYTVTGLEEQLHAFKTPTVRNIALTGPYMHNGVYTTLEEVVEFYHKGGGIGFGIKINNQTLPFDSLQLTNREKEDIVLFMHSLTDTSGIHHTPVKLPVFEKNTALNNRKTGGNY